MDKYTKRILSLVLIAALMLSFTPTTLAYNAQLNGAHFVGGAFDLLRAPSEGLCAFRSGDRWGFVDAHDGSVAIPADYLAVRDFHSGVAAVCEQNGRWAFVNKFGATLLGGLRGASDMSDGFAAVRDDSGLWGYVDADMSLVTDVAYLDARGFADGHAAVRDDTGWYFIDEHGHALSDDRWTAVGDFSDGIAVVRTADGYGAINSSGLVVEECAWRAASGGNGLVTLVGDGVCAIVDGYGVTRLNSSFEEIRGFSEWLAAVRVRGKWGFAASNGTVAIPAVYDEVGDFSRGRAYAKLAGTPGLIDRTGAFTPLGGTTQVGDYDGLCVDVRYKDASALLSVTGAGVAMALDEVAGGENGVYAVRDSSGWRLLHIDGATASSQFPHADAWAVDELRQAGKLGMLDPLVDLDSWSAAVTRERFCSLVVRFYELIGGELPPTDGVRFDDASSAAVLYAAALGLVNGDGNGRFRPNDKLTREEAATILVRFCKLIGFTPDEVVVGSPSDAADISAWAQDAASTLYRAGIFRGDDHGAFRPRDAFSAEAASLTLYRLLHAPGELG